MKCMNKEQRTFKKVMKKRKKRKAFVAQKQQSAILRQRVLGKIRGQMRFDKKEKAPANRKREDLRNDLRAKGWTEQAPYSFFRRLSTGELEFKNI